MNKIKKFVNNFSLVFAILLALLLMLTQFGCEGVGPIGAKNRTEPKQEKDEPRRTSSVRKYIGPNGGDLKLDTCEVVFPPGAVKEGDFFTLRYPDTIAKGAIENSCYIISPEVTLQSQILVRISYSDKVVDAKKSPSNSLKVALLGKYLWQELADQKLDTEKQTVSSLSSRTGTFALISSKTGNKLDNLPPEPKIDVFMPDVSKLTSDVGAFTVTFSADDSTDLEGGVARLEWDFDGDGTFDEDSILRQRVSYGYFLNGSYTCVLKVTDDGARPASAFATATINVERPGQEEEPFDAYITPYQLDKSYPSSVTFASTVHGGQTPYTFKWQFDADTYSEIQAPTHVFNEPGRYNVTCEITDNNGDKILRKTSVRVEDKKRTDIPDLNKFRTQLKCTPLEGKPPLAVNLELRSFDAIGKVSYMISWGDEMPPVKPTLISAVDGKKLVMASHTYQTSGGNLLKVIATDGQKNTTRAFELVSVETTSTAQDFSYVRDASKERNPGGFRNNLEFDVKPDPVDPRSVTFSIISALPGGSKTPDPIFNWDLGDNSTSSQPQPTKTYTKDGIYHIKVRVTIGSDVLFAERWVPVSRAVTLVAIQKPQQNVVYAPHQAAFTALVTNAIPPVKYEWDFGDKSGVLPGQYNLHTYMEPGLYRINLKITDGKGNKASAKEVIYEVRAPLDQLNYPVAFITKGDTEPEDGLGLVDIDGKSKSTFLPVSTYGVMSNPKISLDNNYISYLTDGKLVTRAKSNGLISFEYIPAQGYIYNFFTSDRMTLTAVTISREDKDIIRCYNPKAGFFSITEPKESATLAGISGKGNFVLALVGAAKAKELTLFEIDPEKGKVLGRQVIYQNPVSSACISENGLLLYFIGQRSSHHQIFRVPLDGPIPYPVQQLTEDATTKSSLQCSINGDVVSFLSGDEMTRRLVVGIRKNDTKYSFRDLSARLGFKTTDYRLSPDGQLVVYWGQGPKGTDESNGLNARDLIDRGGSLEDALDVNQKSNTTTKPKIKSQAVGIDRMGLWVIDISGTYQTSFLTESQSDFDLGYQGGATPPVLTDMDKSAPPKGFMGRDRKPQTETDDKEKSVSEDTEQDNSKDDEKPKLKTKPKAKSTKEKTSKPADETPSGELEDEDSNTAPKIKEP